MIWTIALLFLMSIGGTLSDECRKKSRDECHQRFMYRDFPETAEELMTVCQDFQSLGNCIADVLSECDGASKTEIKDIREAVDYLSTTCVEDNPTFKALSSNIQCIEPLLYKVELGCSQYVNPKTDDMLLEHMVPLFQSGRSDLTMCLDALMEIKCGAVLLGYECGDDVKDATEEFLLQLGAQRSYVCTPEIIEEIQPYIDTFEGSLLEVLEMQDELEKRK
nr:venom protein [Lampona murina]